MTAPAKIQCPHCLGGGLVCTYCARVECDRESLTEEHASADVGCCAVCGGDGEVLATVAQVYERRQQMRRALPPPTAAEEGDIPF